MMKNNKVLPIIKNEVERSIKNKAFVILNVLLLLVTVVGLNFNNIRAIFKNKNINLSDSIIVYVKDEDNIAYGQIKAAFSKYDNVEIRNNKDFEKYNTQEVNAEELIKGQNDVNTYELEIKKDATHYVVATLTTQETVRQDYIDTITSTLTSIKDKMILANSNMTKDELAVIKEDVKLDRVILNESIDTSESTEIFQLASNYIIFFILLLCLNKIANTISQEKMSKSIEYILTSISTKEYMISKVLSMALIVVVQFVFEIAYFLIGIMISYLVTKVGANIDGVQAVNASMLISGRVIGYFAITFVYMCLTTFIQGIIQSVMSAKTTNIQEAGNATLVLLTLNLVLYSIVTFMVTPVKAASVFAYILSVLPIASMYFIPSMVLIGQANVIQVILSLVVLIASIPLVLIVTQKPFKNAILDYSSKKNKKIDGIEKIIATREYQERMIERKESSKKGLVVGMAVIILIILQVVTSLGSELIAPVIAQKVTRISVENITLILMCLSFAISIYIPYILLKMYLPKEEKVSKEEKNSEEFKEKRKKSIFKCIKYIILSIPVMSMIQMICSFAIEKFGISSDVMNSVGLFNYSGKLATILLFVEIAILPAIFEELFIRKGVYGILKSRGVVFATIISALVFATIHLNFTQFIFAFLIGILFAMVREKTGKLYPTMILHFINNAVATIEVLFYEHTTFMQIFTYLQIGINAIGFAILIYMLYNKVMELKDKEKIKELKEKLDYRKIKLNISEDLFIFKDYTFGLAVLLAIVAFAVIEKII